MFGHQITGERLGLRLRKELPPVSVRRTGLYVVHAANHYVEPAQNLKIGSDVASRRSVGLDTSENRRKSGPKFDDAILCAKFAAQPKDNEANNNQ
jgi:hypothetical protein